MKRLPLYGTELRAPVEREEPLDRDDWDEVGNDPDPSRRGRACTRCALHKDAKMPCIGADGREFTGPGTTLIVGDAPSKQDENCGRLFISGPAANKLRAAVKKSGVTNVVYDVAVRCRPGKRKVTDKVMRQCKPYLTQTILEAQPSRVITLGAKAAKAIVGASVPLASVRRGYTWLYNKGKQPIPVYFLMHPLMAAMNKFHGRHFEDDLQWALTTDPPAPPPWHATARLVETPEDADAVWAEFKNAEWVTFDYETGGKLFNPEFTAVTVAACVKGSDSPFVWDYRAINDDLLIWPLQRALMSKDIPIVGQYVKYDMLCAQESIGAQVRNIYGDTRLWQKTNNPDADAHLDKMSHLIGMGGHKEEMKKALEKGLRDARKLIRDGVHDVAESIDGLAIAELGEVAGDSYRRLNSKAKYWPGVAGKSPSIDKALRNLDDIKYAKEFEYTFADEQTLLRYCARDVVSTDRLAIHFDNVMDNETEGVKRVWRKVIKPLTPALAKVEEWGMPAHKERIINTGRFFHSKLAKAEKRLAPYNLNLNSPIQIRKLLFDNLGLKPVKFTDTGAPSTDSEVLEALQDKHQVVGDILMFRKYEKLYKTYSVGLAHQVRADGRIHPNVKPDGARSGRLSCTEPNLQNIPSEKEIEGQMLRDCFVAEEGNVIVSLDYSQIELRIAAMLSGDPVMREIYISGDDFHLRTAKLISQMAWGIKPEQVETKHRREAKCFHPDTEVLTRSGWKRITDLCKGEQVMTCEAHDGFKVTMSWDTPTDVFTAHHPDAELVHFKNEGIDIRVTPDHGMLAFSATGKPQKVLPEEFPRKRYWANAGEFNGGDWTPDETLLRLACATQADGHIDAGGAIRFRFTKHRKIDRLRALLASSELLWTTGTQADGSTWFRVSTKTAHLITDLLDGKSLPWKWLQLANIARLWVLDEVPYWDGHDRSDWTMRLVTSTDRQTIDVLQALATMTGHKTRLADGSGGCWRLSIKDHHTTRSGNLNVTHVEHTDEVACLTVPSGIVVVRDGGIPLISRQTFNFGLLYGMGDGRLARSLGITVNAARQVRSAILGSFRDLAKFIQECERETRNTGYTWTWWDGQRARRRELFSIADADSQRRSTAENGAFNTPVQGTASEFNTMSLIECVDWIVGDCIPTRLIIPIHDSLMFEVPEEHLVEVVDGAREIMTSWNSGGIPLVVDAEFGKSWGTMRQYNCVKCGEATPHTTCRHGDTIKKEHSSICCGCMDGVLVADAQHRLDGEGPV